MLALLDDVEAKYKVDKSRVYLTGLSMGGYGSWSLGLAHPGRFATIAPICGGGDPIVLHLAGGWLFIVIATLLMLKFLPRGPRSN